MMQQKCREEDLPDPRFWDKEFEDWLEDTSQPKPGPHPWPDHLWNKDQSLYDWEQHRKYLGLRSQSQNDNQNDDDDDSENGLW